MNKSDLYTLDAFSVRGRTAVITGAGSGIGRATARLFAANGANVVVSGRNTSVLELVAQEISEAGGQALPVTADVVLETQIQALFKSAGARFGTVDILVTCHAYPAKHPTLSMTVEEFDHMLAVFGRGTFLCLREAVRSMRAGGKGGAVVTVSTVAAKRPAVLGAMDYDAAKAGVEAMTRAAALEFAGDNVRVNAIRPGATRSDSILRARLRAAGADPQGPITKTGRILMGRRAEPIEQARAIMFLASPAASYITGQTLAVDGGFLVS